MSLFQHGVASGDPDIDRVVIWTRVSPDDARTVPLRWTVARDAGMAGVVATGEVDAGPSTDYTAQADVDGLEPNSHYWYVFDAEGERSPVGRTRTLPV